MTMVQQLSNVLPDNFTAEPRVHLGTYFEIDVCAYEQGEHDSPGETPANGGRIATATRAPPQPTLTFDSDLGEQYEYEVLVYDQSRGRQLVAAVEIVSPANKDRPENRRAFIAKCVALLQNRVCVSIVDLITTRQFNLYTDLLNSIKRSDPALRSDPAFSPVPPPTYAVTCRGRRVGGKPRFETWAYPLGVGQALPTLPIWLMENLMVSLDLEASYEETCRVLRIR